MTSPVAPVNFRALPKADQFGFERVVEKVVANCVVKGLGRDLLIQVYLAGLYHGSEAAEGWPSSAEGEGDGR